MTKVQQEFQSIIDDLTEPSNSKVKKTIVITRVVKTEQTWEIEVDLPVGPPDLIDDILNALNNEGLDWGPMKDQDVLYCEDEFEVKS